MMAQYTPYKGRDELEIGQRVRTHYNFIKKCFSITIGGVVRSHADSVMLLNPKFVVSEAGRLRVLKNKVKNVHAMVEGNIQPVGNIDISEYRKGAYNPYKYGYFYDVLTNEPIKDPSVVLLHDRGIYFK